MGLFKRKNKVLDLTKHYEKQQEKLEQIKQEETTASPLGASFSMFGADPAPSSSSSDDYADLSTGIDQKKRKLVKRIMDMSSKMEDLSNQIYHLEQRIEVLERKGDPNRF